MIGLRYTRAKRRNRFISFISLISMVGIALGVAVLIVVLSVMNGFQTEVRTRILGVASHLVLTGPGGQLSDWESVARMATEHPRVLAAAPFVQAQAMLTGEGTARGVAVRGPAAGRLRHRARRRSRARAARGARRQAGVDRAAGRRDARRRGAAAHAAHQI